MNRQFLMALALAGAALAPMQAAHAQVPAFKAPRDADPKVRTTTTVTRPPATTSPNTESRAALVQRAYMEGVKRNNRVQPGDPTGWMQVARYTGLGYDDLVASYDAIAVVNMAYKQLLGRAADSAGAAFQVAAMRGGMTWKQLWRNLAQSAEREQKFGYWAAAPIPTSDEALKVFGFRVHHPEQCFGAIGDRCEGGMPNVPGTPDIQPRWVDQFTLPDGTRMGWIEQGVAVGSILHDNACLIHPLDGLNCNGITAGDLIKQTSDFAAPEWAKASWNVLDGRSWRDRFGPYPVDKEQRRAEWYDDLRMTPAREAWMRTVNSVTVGSTYSERYTGNETKNTRRLSAPAGRGLDEKDGAFCKTGSFSGLKSTPFTKWGVCR